MYRQYIWYGTKPEAIGTEQTTIWYRFKNPHSTADYLTDLAILGGLIFEYSTVREIIMEAIMQESSVIQHFLQQGIEQGARQMSIESTLTILAERFPDADITRVKPILEAIEDLDRLKQLNLTASIAESFLAFRDRLEA